MPSKLTREKFIAKSNLVHKNKYDYSLVDYINNDTKIKIICPLHGEFTQLAKNHLKSGCFKCGIFRNEKRKVYNTQTFISAATKIHNNKYDYSKSV